MSLFRKNPAPEKVPTEPIVIPDDIGQARAVASNAEDQRVETLTESYRQQSWFERSVAPMLEELRQRRDQNGFGQEFELSIMPKNRG